MNQASGLLDGIPKAPAIIEDWELLLLLHPISLMQALGIHHVAIICSDYERSKHFYTNVLGFKVIHETFRESRNSYKLDLQVGDRDRIELFSFPDPPSRASGPEARGLRHLAFQVKDLDESVANLEAQGISVEPIRVDEITGRRFTFFRDPDNLPLELYEQ